MRVRSSACLLTFAWVLHAVVAFGAEAENAAVSAARSWRSAHERAIVGEYLDFLRVPNVSRDSAGVRRNAALVRDMMERRGLHPRFLEVPGAAPVVYGELPAPGAKHTYVFYAHYDGQPVTPSEWASPPFEPTLRTGRLDRGGKVVTLPQGEAPLDPEWRIYARAAADDKLNVAAILNALDALRASGLKPRANLKFVFEGEEEIGSEHLADVLQANRDLLRADLWLICDGPQHSSGRQTVMFGARGVQSLEITVFGARRELHSGHYGNWAPNPAMMLARLLASMKDDQGRVTIAHFYDGLVPLGPLERKALAEIPNDEADLKRDFWLSGVEGGGKSLQELINQPSLNVRGLASAHVGEQATNVVPSTATADLDLRLVKGLDHQRQAQRVIDHVAAQGYHVVSADPDQATRMRYPRVAKVVVGEGGYDAVRTPMDLPAAQRVVEVVRSVRAPVVLQPTSGGSVPLAMIETILGTHTIMIPLANYDDAQHSHDENLLLGSFWNAIETQAALLMME
jgi:acetylornithine deacetylase/succinyl-diaminopimelate desuccinylase-like protein